VVFYGCDDLSMVHDQFSLLFFFLSIADPIPLPASVSRRKEKKSRLQRTAGLGAAALGFSPPPALRRRSDGRAHPRLLPTPRSSPVPGDPPLPSRAGAPLRLPGSQSGCKRIAAAISHTRTEAISCTRTKAISASTPQAFWYPSAFIFSQYKQSSTSNHTMLHLLIVALSVKERQYLLC